MTEFLPEAQQVVDRWHLLKNLGEAIERFLEKKYLLLQKIFCQENKTKSFSQGKQELQLLETREEGEREGKREGKREREREGEGEREGEFDEFPQQARGKRKKTLLSLYQGYLKKRWEAGESNFL